MITLPPIKKKEIPRQYFAALDHLWVVFYYFIQVDRESLYKRRVNMKREEMMQYIIEHLETLNEKALLAIMDIVRLLTK